MDRKVWWIAVGLLALVGLAGPLASAQTAQTVIVEISGTVIEVPDELPGVYEVGLEVDVDASGGQCVCRQTSVDLQARDVPEPVDAFVFSPRSFVVDWTSQPSDAGHGHQRAVHVHVGVSEVPDDASMIAVTVGADARSSNPLVTDRVQPTQLALPLPDEDAGTAQASANSTDAGDGEDEDVSLAGTETSRSPRTNLASSWEDEDVSLAGTETASGDDAGGVALGTGAATAGLALAGLAAHRHRDPRGRS